MRELCHTRGAAGGGTSRCMIDLNGVLVLFDIGAEIGQAMTQVINVCDLLAYDCLRTEYKDVGVIGDDSVDDAG